MVCRTSSALSLSFVGESTLIPGPAGEPATSGGNMDPAFPQSPSCEVKNVQPL